MTISWNWLKEYIDIDHELSIDAVSSILTDIGLEVEQVEKFESIKGGLANFYLGEVLSCVKHPNADKLSLTEVNLGAELGVRKIVCGAPNVAQGQKVVVAAEGSVIYMPNGESFTIKNSKIRGEESQGMICAEDELGIGQSHDGILVLPPDVNPGQPASKYFNISSDYIFEIGLTPNRTDAMSHYGVARDLVAGLQARGFHAELKSKLEIKKDFKSNLSKEVKIQLETDLAPSFRGVIFEGVQNQVSPDWMQLKLKTIGETPKNLFVDITNYILHDLGQPMHAYDLSKIDSSLVSVSTLADQEEMIALNGQTLKLQKGDIVIRDKSKTIGLAGIMGAENSAITIDTNSIFLEAAHFDGTQVRKTSQRLNLRSESSAKFEKGIDPNGAEIALNKAYQILAEIYPEMKNSEIFSQSLQNFEPFKVQLTSAKLIQYAHLEIPKSEIESILISLGIEIISFENNEWSLSISRFKTEVTREEDIIEEILRIYGFDKLPYPKYMRSSLSFNPKLTSTQFEAKLIDRLVGFGLSEILTNSISQSRYSPDTVPIKLLNSMTSELDCMRTSMIPDILEVLEYNINRDQKDLSVFELGHEYALENQQYIQRKKLAVVITGLKDTANWQEIKGVKNDYFKLKSILELIQASFNYTFDFQELNHAKYSYGMSIWMNTKLIGQLGEIKIDSNLFSIKQPVFSLELDLNVLYKASLKQKVVFKEVVKFPSVKRDLALVIDQKVTFHEIKAVCQKVLGSKLIDLSLFDVYQDKSLGENKKSYAIRLTIQDIDKTMSEKEIEALISKVISEVKSKLNAEIRA